MRFRTWLRGQRERGGPVGQAARQVAADRCLRASSLRGIRRHMRKAHGAGEFVADQLMDAWVEFQRDPAACATPVTTTIDPPVRTTLGACSLSVTGTRGAPPGRVAAHVILRGADVRSLLDRWLVLAPDGSRHLREAADAIASRARVTTADAETALARLPYLVQEALDRLPALPPPPTPRSTDAAPVPATPRLVDVERVAGTVRLSYPESVALGLAVRFAPSVTLRAANIRQTPVALNADVELIAASGRPLIEWRTNLDDAASRERLAQRIAQLTGAPAGAAMATVAALRGRIITDAFLRGVLASGPLPAFEVERAAHTAGLSPTALRRAKRRLHVASRRVGGLGRCGHWEWSSARAAVMR